MTKSTKIIIGILIVVIIGLLARYVVFKKQIDEWGQGLDRIGQWETQYKQEHPGATQTEVDAAFKTGMSGMQAWKDNYKKAHPEATDAQADAALKAQFENN